MSGPFGSSQWMYSSGAEFYDFPIEQSLKFNDNDSSYLSWTPASAGNRKTWTWSGWVKRGNLGGTQTIFGTGSGAGGSVHTALTFNTSNQLDTGVGVIGVGTIFSQQTNAVFRDTSAWYHIVLVYDTSNATSTDRVRIYVNGERQSVSGSFPSQNYDCGVNTTQQHRIGSFEYAPSNLLDGYLAEVNFIDGTALDPTSFGEFKSGVWIPKEYGGTYGTNGFRLSFADSANIGDDTSGNTNDWTANSLVATDVLLDSPTNNFCTLNPLDTYGGAWTLSEGNLKGASSAVNGCRRSTMSVSSGKYYWEVYIADSLNYHVVGVSDQTCNGWATTLVGGSATGVGWFYAGRSTTSVSTDVNANTYANYGSSFTLGDIVGVALDMDAGTIEFYKNGVSQGVAYSNLSGYTLSPTMAQSSGSVMTDYYNFGQDSSFAGNKTAQGNTDANGVGDFYHSVPSGYLALAASNLPNPTIDPAQDDVPSDYMNTVLYSGNSSTQSITGVGFQPDWVWIKSRNISGANHVLTDAVRGVEKFIFSNLTDNEFNVANTLTSFDADGFSLGNTAYDFNISGNNYVAWNWLAGNGTSSNTDGSITSTVSVNQKAGFSIVSWIGNGSNTAQSIGHGLGAVPSLVITKNRDQGAYNWQTLHGATTNGTYNLNTTDAINTGWQSFTNGSFDPSNLSSTTFSTYPGLSTSNFPNGSGEDYIAYCFAEVEGYSKFGKYTGNGSSDGPFVYTGFEVAWLMVKRTDSTSEWVMEDAAREPYNDGLRNSLYADLSNAEDNDAFPTDFLSNGFKQRNSGGVNASGGTYIYMAFAENPFKYANAR